MMPAVLGVQKVPERRDNTGNRKDLEELKIRHGLTVQASNDSVFVSCNKHQ